MMCQLAWIYRFARFATAHEAGIQQTGDYRILSERRTGCNTRRGMCDQDTPACQKQLEPLSSPAARRRVRLPEDALSA